MMEDLNCIVNKLDNLFRLSEFEKDPAFSRLFPIAYSKVDYCWESYFEEEYLERFNGLMIRGENKEKNILCSVTPTEEVLSEFIEKSTEGDMLLLHHPVNCENGDPRGTLGRGLIPAKQEQLSGIKRKKLSLYSCHIPMDIHPEAGIGIALVKALGGRVTDCFLPMGYGYDGLIFEMEPVSTKKLISKLEDVFSELSLLPGSKFN
jgi:putative NIF3 family GTP cyclohydrolase 1 type 2